MNGVTGVDLVAIVENPTLWARHMEEVYRKGDVAIRALQTALHSIPGPVARARECQTLLALNLLDDATRLVENESHPLCQAMWLMTELAFRTPEAYLQQVSLISGIS
ncbi:MAG: hypothetical protein U0Z75_07955 [Deinococcaceae bacterium]